MLALAGCASQSEYLRELIANGELEAAVREGDAWMLERGDGEPEERVRVRAALATARLKQLGPAAKMAAYEALVSTYRDVLTRGQLEAVRDYTGDAQWRERVAPADTVERYRAFRLRFPEHRRAAEARRREVARAFADASDEIDRQRSFRETYGEWREAAHLMSSSRAREARLAFSAAQQTDEREAWQAFRADYARWPEAESLRARALEEEAGAELARAAGDVAKLERFLESYAHGEWPQRGRAALAEAAVAPIVAQLEAGEAPSRRVVETFLESHLDRPGVAEALGLHRERLVAAAQAHERSAPSLLVRHVFPDDPAARSLYPREVRLAWGEAEAAGDAAGWARFVRWHTGDPRAEEAEARMYRLRRLDTASEGWPRATVAYWQRLKGGGTQVVVDVRDCDDRRISGLTRETFEVYVGGDPREVTAFRGLESERPLDLVFALDLSGSMAAEREAVRTAVMQFAEAFRFRGRRTRLGLVTFSDEVVQQKRPVGGARSFRRWMEALPDNRGGLGEDSTHGLLAAARLLDNSRAERVVVLLTDEDLQLNQGGRRALGLRTSSICKRLRRVPKCAQKCTTPKCLNRCYGQISPDTRRAMDRCVRRLGHRWCAAFADWDSIMGGLASCAQPVPDGSELATKIAARLRRRGVRPFFVVPGTDEVAEHVIQGFEHVAREALGRVIPVPHNSSTPDPYVRALLDIADQVSKQYVLEYRSGASDDPAPVVLAGYQHRWMTRRPLPGGQLLAVHAAGRHDGCPRFVAVTPGAIHQSTGCDGWARHPLPEGVTVLGATAGAGKTLLNAGDRLLEWDPEETRAARLDWGVETVIQTAVGGDGARWALGRAGTEVRVVREGAQLGAGLAGVGAAALVLDERNGGQPCVVTSDVRRCLRHGRWRASAVDDFPVPSTPVELISLRGEARAALLVDDAGSVWRGIDAGSRWRRVLPDVGARALVRQAGGTVCVSASTAVFCSADAGRSWTRMGYDRAVVGPATLTVVGPDLYLGDARGLNRLERVVGRDAPASAMYFETDDDRFDPRMQPFLDEVAQTMTAQPDLTLLVEGHADHRGSDAHNDDLSRRRAQRVADAIIGAGIEARRFHVSSYGSRRPIRSGRGAADLARNRRVELVMLRPVRRGPAFDDCGRPVALAR